MPTSSASTATIKIGIGSSLGDLLVASPSTVTLVTGLGDRLILPWRLSVTRERLRG